MQGPRWFRTLALALALGASGCAASGADPESVGMAAADLQIDVGRRAVAYDYAHRTNMVHGVAGDERLVFVTEPLNGRVVALDRVTGREVGNVAAPPGGWLLPFTLRVPRTGRLVVMDPGGFPSPTAPSIPRVYDYDYHLGPGGVLTTTLVRTVRFDGLPVVFSEDLEVTDDGTYVLSESILGELWLINRDGSIVPGIIPDSFAPGEGVPQLSPCSFPGTTVDGVPFTTAGNFAPGVGTMASRAGYLYFGSTCTGGIQRVPIASLRDASRSPAQRAADITTVSPRPAGVVETLHGLAFNRFDPHDERLYAADPFRLRVLRIDVHTGAREVLLADRELFNFPVALAFAPPVLGLTPLLVASDQEHRLAALNPAITEDQFIPPFVVTKVYVLH